MHSKNTLKVILLLLLGIGITFAQVTISVPSGLKIDLSGKVELEFVDVEGAGGFTNKDLTFQKVKNRSPHVRIDKAILGTKVNYSENLTYTIEFRFDDDGAKVDKHYARLKMPNLNTRFEFGNNRPFIAAKRHTEGYPLIGTAFWKGRELHLTSESKINLGSAIKLDFGLSVAMKRPIESDDVAEDKSFKMLTYGDYKTKDGQTWEYGVKGGIELLNIKTEGWFYYGKLIDDYDWKTQLSQSLQSYNSYGDEKDITHYWYGGRVSYDLGGFHTRAEYIYAQDGLLPRDGAYVEGGYTFKKLPEFIPFKNVSFRGRTGFLNLKPLESTDGEDLVWEYLAEPMSWSRKMTTISLITKINEFISIKAEYYLLDEETGSDKESSVKDNQGLVQINFAF